MIFQGIGGERGVEGVWGRVWNRPSLYSPGLETNKKLPYSSYSLSSCKHYSYYSRVSLYPVRLALLPVVTIT